MEDSTMLDQSRTTSYLGGRLLFVSKRGELKTVVGAGGGGGGGAGPENLLLGR